MSNGKVLKGWDAITYAEAHGVSLDKASDPIDGYRKVSPSEAREIARQDPGLLSVRVTEDDACSREDPVANRCPRCNIDAPLEPSRFCQACQGDLWVAFGDELKCGKEACGHQGDATTFWDGSTPERDLARCPKCQSTLVVEPRYPITIVPDHAELDVTIRVRVMMRPPSPGERGWYVRDTATAAEALQEVLAESEEFGWIAPPDFNESYADLPNVKRDRPITIEIEKQGAS